jgi:Beta propeller domain
MLSLDGKLRSAVLSLTVATACTLSATALATTASAEQVRTAPHDTMTPFASDRQLKRYLKRTKRAQRQNMPVPTMAVPAPPPAPPAPSAAPSSESKSAAAGESITNTQEAGVDEGGIVKMHGETIVILRRGRLFTVSTRGSGLKPIDFIDAFPPGTSGNGAWYDEMLVAGNRVIVIGYSYARGGTEINRFRIDGNGNLDFEDAYHLRSNDYYSSRNYASRLIGQTLIVYSPLYLPYGNFDNFEWLPGVRRWTGDAKRPFNRIVGARQIYLPENLSDPYNADVDTLHTVTSCNLATPVLRCEAQGVLGSSSRTFYVSGNAVYVWVGNNRYYAEESGKSPSAMLYRMPLRGGRPSAIGVRGNPIDQFSFREDWNEGMLNVVVRSNGGGDAMWNPEFNSGAIALLRLPLYAFGDGDDDARQAHYRKLPSPSRESYYTMQNRFVGNNLLYGAGNSWGRPRDAKSTLVVAPVRAGEPVQFELNHGIDRIEALGSNAVVIGADSSDLHFQAVELTAPQSPVIGDRYTLERASQGETRSHGFFFKPAAYDNRGADDGYLALPVARAARPGASQLIESSAAITFLRRVDREFAALGELFADDDRVVDDKCQASCVDWYGNARPIFLRNRTLALMGYELVEGDLTDNGIKETRRVNFAPGAR